MDRAGHFAGAAAVAGEEKPRPPGWRRELPATRPLQFPNTPAGATGVPIRKRSNDMQRNATSRVRKVLEWLKPLVMVMGVILPFRSVIADWNVVPSGSMKPTIVEGDRILVDKLAYDLRVPFTTLRLARWGDPQRGDIVVLFAPDSGTRLVKRVVGLPGDRLEITGGTLVVNGAPLAYRAAAPGSYAALDAFEQAAHEFAEEQLGAVRHPVMLWRSAARRASGTVQVPAGHYFVLGDNRDNSRDSRYFGFVERDQIVGRATHVLASFDPGHRHRPRAERFFTALP
jgi:signal peptidase I